MNPDAAVDLSALIGLMLCGVAIAALPLAWLVRRHRGAGTARRLQALTLVTLFLTFDLVLFGAFTRLTDSGLGCPDWPGCYGHASPIGAHAQISLAQAELPSGPVTHGKAWIEMVHRYLASGVGVLLTVLMAWSWRAARRPSGPPDDARISPLWATASFIWVCLQGAFGALTVTMKLYPAIVTAHLLGGVGLLALLAVQAQRFALQAPPPDGSTPSQRSWLPCRVALPTALHRATWAVLGLAVVQVALGGWVSTNYAVLACSDFPTCQGSWWPPMDFASGYTGLRELGRDGNGEYLPFAALTAIHYTHRAAALVVFAALGALAGALWRTASPDGRRYAAWLLALAAWQFASGLSNVVLGWPLVAALAHTGGAATLVAVLAALVAGAVRASPLPTSPTSSTEPQPATRLSHP